MAAQRAERTTPDHPGFVAFEAGVVLPTLALIGALLARRPAALEPSLLLWGALIAVVDLLPVPAWRGLMLLLDFPLLVAVATLHDPAAAALTLFVASVDPRLLRGEVGLLRNLFNRSQLALSALAASVVYQRLAPPPAASAEVAVAALGAILAAYAVNATLVAVGASLLYRESLARVSRQLRIGHPVEFLVSYLGLGGIGVVAARLYEEVGFWAVLSLVVPLVVIRQLFFRTLALDRARAELAAAYEAERARVKDLEELDRRKAELSRMLTHDFMHAIASLRTYASTLIDRWEQLEDTRRLEVVLWIERGATRLRDLAEHSAALMQLDTDSLTLTTRPERAGDLAREASDSLPELAERLQVVAEGEAEEALVRADTPRVLQALRNLLINAERYSPPGTPIELRIRDGGAEVVYTVTDHGPGIAPEDLPRLFRRFSRLDNSRDVPGSGLGLYIARRIAEAHGGRIWVESRVGEGSSFSLALPKEDGALRPAPGGDAW
ncbi:MAG TPA: sensor histidine kinase [Actinomycetota bacterium]|nr:sensor histidine kinase [Actinomycetota bacterium]